jgi:hypothetical protein
MEEGSVKCQKNGPKRTGCPTEGCDGIGNLRKGKKTHSSIKYCPNKYLLVNNHKI